MKKQKKISEAVIRRLPRYYRYLGDLKADGISRISSKDLSALMGITASQIRQDLNCFGGFGQQGYGYNVELLYEEIGNILGTDNENSVILLGAGNLGKAIANYANFKKRGFSIKAIFDKNEEVIGKKINGIPVYDINTLADYLNENSIDNVRTSAIIFFFMSNPFLYIIFHNKYLTRDYRLFRLLGLHQQDNIQTPDRALAPNQAFS